MSCGSYSKITNTYSCHDSTSRVCRDFEERTTREAKARDEAELREKYFLSYAVRGPMACPNTCRTNRAYEHAIRYGMPDTYPIAGPVKGPSPLNNQWWYAPPVHPTCEGDTGGDEAYAGVL